MIQELEMLQKLYTELKTVDYKTQHRCLEWLIKKLEEEEKKLESERYEAKLKAAGVYQLSGGTSTDSVGK